MVGFVARLRQALDRSRSCSSAQCAAPQVTGSTPTNGATNVPAGSDITVTFREPVDATTSSFTVLCPGAITYTLSASPASTFTLNPAASLPDGVTCTVTVVANQIADVDTGDPPDTLAANHVFSFTVQELAPSVVSTSPANGATDVPVNSDIVVPFNEAVTFPDAAFLLACPNGVVLAGGYTVSGSGTNVMTLNPNLSLPTNTTCRLTIDGAAVSEVDTVDPPDTMGGTTVVDFTTAP